MGPGPESVRESSHFIITVSLEMLPFDILREVKKLVKGQTGTST